MTFKHFRHLISLKYINLIAILTTMCNVLLSQQK